jgi:hypothetical protein
MNKTVAAVTLILLSAAPLMAATTVTKDPDQGPHWRPLGASGSYVYANSFVAPTSGPVSSLGTWLTDNGLGGPTIRFEVLGSSNSSSGPNVSNILARTAVLGPFSGSLAFHTATPLGGSTPLISGQTYWFAASVIGLSGSGEYQTGGHTQNSEGIVDNGTFWYSNDPAGASFDGREKTPEMAFSVSQVPEPGTIFLAAVGFAGLLVLVRSTLPVCAQNIARCPYSRSAFAPGRARSNCQN